MPGIQPCFAQALRRTSRLPQSKMLRTANAAMCRAFSPFVLHSPPIPLEPTPASCDEKNVSSAPPSAHPEWLRLHELRQAALDQIAACLTDLQDLEGLRRVTLGRYAAAFADRLTTLDQLEVDAARLKREIDLIQQAVNRGEEPDHAAIDRTLTDEFAEWLERLAAAAESYSRQRGVLDHLLDPQRATRLRKAFRALVKRLHPDLHPDQPAHHVELWHRAMSAYDGTDLDSLEAIEVISREPAAPTAAPSTPDSLDTLASEVENLQNQLRRLLEQLAAQRKTWPLDQLTLLSDPAATSTRQQQLDQRITEARETCRSRRRWLDHLLGH